MVDPEDGRVIHKTKYMVLHDFLSTGTAGFGCFSD